MNYVREIKVFFYICFEEKKSNIRLVIVFYDYKFYMFVFVCFYK